jgi:hypothetical protein
MTANVPYRPEEIPIEIPRPSAWALGTEPYRPEIQNPLVESSQMLDDLSPGKFVSKNVVFVEACADTPRDGP